MAAHVMRRLVLGLVALVAVVGLTSALGACTQYHPTSYPVPAAQTTGDPNAVAWAQGCSDDNGNRVDDDFCDTPHPHYYPMWGSVYGDGGTVIIPVGGHYPGIWTRSRPAGVTVTNTVTHVSRTGGTVLRNGTGSAVSAAARVGNRPVTPRPTVQTNTGGRASGAGLPPAKPSSTVSRGGLGVPSAKRSK